MNLAAAAAFVATMPALAQVETVDPNQAYQEYRPAPDAAPAYPEPEPYQSDPLPADNEAAPADSAWTPIEQQPPVAAPDNSGSQRDVYAAPANPYESRATVPREDVFTAAEGVFGRGARGLGEILESILRDQGEPSAYIAGEEASGAFVIGVRYGSGVMHHQIEGERNVYWTGPSIGFDVGADANKVFVLVYNLHDSQDLFRRYPGAEGHAYFVGGFNAQYMRRGDVVLIPVRLGVGVRLGVNAGYMRFSERNRWLPF
ncbi:DUF1134 domain-containing protein [Sphingosinicella sp. LHD-64]|uniref:DUF1134 domain-containing protein n=1 Tax=Sphingosinicella sp. LHD-64 TaxID=3072139 RepID=UPI00280F5737|nr:DUF1134 domain-containing protein [Sphingosinicella sp. LHD-64]MDQ8755892.1 DUF1134 domain-containing protein [Sphingosinicella sp. LHD-64]